MCNDFFTWIMAEETFCKQIISLYGVLNTFQRKAWRNFRIRIQSTKFSIWINPRSEWFGMKILFSSIWTWIDLDWKICPDPFQFNRIEVSDWTGMSRIDLWPFFIEQDSKRFSDCLGMFRKKILEWLGFARIESFPKLSSGISLSLSYREYLLNFLLSFRLIRIQNLFQVYSDSFGLNTQIELDWVGLISNRFALNEIQNVF